MKKLIFSAALILSLGLAACSETTTENLGGSVNNATSGSSNNETSTNETSKEEETKDETQEINQVIVDNEHFSATLVRIVKKNDDIWGQSYEVVFDVENKRADSIEVQAREVSADGRMIDETLLSMSDEIAPGKKGYAKLTISEYEGYDFPEITSDFEMVLHVFSWDDFEWNHDERVQVSFE